MTVTRIFPNETTQLVSTTINGGVAAHTALSDGSDATYTGQNDTTDLLRVGLGSFTLGSNRVKSVRLFVRGWETGPNAPAGSLIQLIANAPIFSSVRRFPTNSGPAVPTLVALTASVSLTQSEINGLQVALSPRPRSSGSGETASVVRTYEVFADVTHVPLPVTVIKVVAPDPYTASTVVPISWTNTFDADGGGQTRYQVIVRDTVANREVLNTGTVASSATARNVGPLTNGTYSVQVRVAQTINGALHWSLYSSDAFTVDVPTSDVSSVTAAPFGAQAKIGVTVTRAGGSAAWNLLEVERSFDGGVSWSPVRTATVVDATGDANTFTVDDHEVPRDTATRFRARATYYSGGLPITGAWVESSPVSWSAGECDEWLIDPLNPTTKVKIEAVDVATQSRSTSAGVFSPIGRRDAVVVGDVLSSPVGSITIRTTGVGELRALDSLLAGGNVFVLSLKADSMIGPNRDGFTYIALLAAPEEWETKFYVGDGTDQRLTTLSYATVRRPRDGTTGVV